MIRSKVFKRGPVTPQMNITPLIDVVFLLIIFFMLVSNIASEETVKMFVPQLDDPKTYELADENVLVVNIAPSPERRSRSAPLHFDGEPRYVKVGPMQQFDIDDVVGVTEALRQAKVDNPELRVVLRGDAALYFDAVQPVMEAIGAADINTVHLAAYLPGQGPMAGAAQNGGQP